MSNPGWMARELMAEQLSPEWFEARLAAITGSIAGDIMPGKSGKVPDWSKMMYKKAVELMAGVDESKPIPKENADWGHFWEPYAREAYIKKTGTNLLEPGLIRSTFDNLVATSPDGLTKTGLIALEIKCPMTMAKHLQYINESPAKIISSVQLEKRYYWQVRMHLLCTGAEVCDFVTFHDSFDPMPIHITTIERDQKELDMMQDLCTQFIKLMKNFTKKILSEAK